VRPRPRLAPSGLFLVIYGVVRFIIEFVRVPDEHIGYLAGGWLTEGQVLSVPMIVVGLALLAYAYRARSPSGNFVTAQ
jgi:phosphatidylglycerol:prolipoprotein diacylglycerol transferase